MPAVRRRPAPATSATPASATAPPSTASKAGFSPSHSHPAPKATLRVVLPPGHPADADAVALARLAGERWVATPPGTACRAMLDNACRTAGYVPDVPFHANDFGVLAAYVAAGLGVAMVPALALVAFGPDVVVRPVADVPVTRRIYVCARRGGLERPALAAMVEALVAGQTATRSGL